MGKTKTTCQLFAPKGFWALTEQGKDEYCNGCGPKGIGGIIPDSIFGVDISMACNIHDYMYALGETNEDKSEADRAFLNNMVRIIDAKSTWSWIKKLRIWMARKYYGAVAFLGGPAFWDDKNSSEEMMTVGV